MGLKLVFACCLRATYNSSPSTSSICNVIMHAICNLIYIHTHAHTNTHTHTHTHTHYIYVCYTHTHTHTHTHLHIYYTHLGGLRAEGVKYVIRSLIDNLPSTHPRT
jgi:hypothetical protein